MSFENMSFENKNKAVNDNEEKHEPHFNITPSFKQSVIIFVSFFVAACLIMALSHMV